MKNILFPTDFSPTAQNAFKFAVEMAQSMGVKIDLISIFHLPVADASSVPPDYINLMIEDKKKEIAAQMDDFVKDHKDIIGTARIDYGVFIATEICEAAGDADYELIVMGTKGNHNQVEKLMGSVTTHTMMYAPCPVLAIPEAATYKPIERIAFATDFHPKDEHAVQQLQLIADALQAETQFVHVQSPRAKPSSKTETHPYFKQIREISGDNVMDTLDTYIQEEQIDILAMFIPRRKLWERLFHSSFTKRMTFHSAIPLLVFRA